MNLPVNILKSFHFGRRRFMKSCSQFMASSNCFNGIGKVGNNVENIRKYSVVGLARANTQLKKPFKKKNTLTDKNSETLKISAFCTAEEFDFERLANSLDSQIRFRITDFRKQFVDSDNVIHMVLANVADGESKDVFIFRNGSVVLWNLNDDEISDVLNYLKGFHIDSFSMKIVENENEVMAYIRSPESTKTVFRDGKVFLSVGRNEIVEKYAISNAMALSVLLGAYESLLEDYIESMLPVTEDLKSGNKIKMSKKEVLMKMGHLFALRHVINLSSDLLDTPDFYWEREELENLYQRTFNHFCIARRTRIMNEKINHCIELVDLLSSQLSDSHHIRLEWMIIVLIMIEVGFEFFHYLIVYSA